MEKAKEYLNKKQLKQNAESIKEVFKNTLTDYLHGEISARLFNAVCEEIQQMLNTNDIKVEDACLLNAIEDGTELEYYRQTSEDLAKAEDRLKEFYKKTTKI